MSVIIKTHVKLQLYITEYHPFAVTFLLQLECTTHAFIQGQKQQLMGTWQVQLNYGDNLTWRKLTTLSKALGFHTNQRA